MAFKQNSDLFYLTGVDQEETVLVLMPDAVDPKEREILFVKETSELIAIWEGQKLTKEQAREVSGIERIEWSQHLRELPAPHGAADGPHLSGHQRAPAGQRGGGNPQRPFHQGLPGALSAPPLRAARAADAPPAHHQGCRGNPHAAKSLRHHRGGLPPVVRLHQAGRRRVGDRGGVAA